MTESEAALREAFRRIAELERKLKDLKAQVGSSTLLAVQIQPAAAQ